MTCPRILRAARLFAIAAPIAVLAIVAIVGPGWLPSSPRWFRRGLIEAAMRGVLLGYWTLAVVSLVGLPMTILLARRARRAGRQVSRRRLMAMAASLASLVALLALEAGSSAWRTWMHRLPALPMSFDPTPPGEYRIVVLGGSSALGEPYRPWVSVGQILAWQLGEADPSRRFECEILAWLGESLEQQHQKLARIRKRPDAVIVYSGHNEFVARFENGREERDPGIVEEPGGWLSRRLYRTSLFSPFCRLAYEIISKNRLDDPPPLDGRHRLIDPPLCSPSEEADILAGFRRRLEAIVGYCDQIGALPILIVPPANESGFEPSRSTLPSWITAEERAWVVSTFESAHAVELSHPDRAESGYRAILGRHPEFAEAHFRMARLLEAAGKTAEAGRHYLEALDHDGLPIRCPAPFREAYAEVARRHPRCLLIDGRRELSAASPTGLIGDAVIQDAHHPTLVGTCALASAVLRAIQERKALGRLDRIPLPLEPESIARHFMMDGPKWSTVCERTSTHYHRVAGYRFDPTERLEKARLYAEAARIVSGSTTIGLIRDLLHLPVLQIDGRPPTEELHDRDELVPLPAPDHRADNPLQRPVDDPDPRPNRHHRLGRDGQARVKHPVDLPKIANKVFLVDHLQDIHQPVAPKRGESVVRVAVKEDITGKERRDGLNPPPLRRPAFLDHLR